MKKSILIVASGTGGHVVPAINISEKLLNHKLKIIWIGTKVIILKH
jgi:UDP-N-acetylglucosamine:LPS N-acetylglucosamine transferase